MYPESVLISKKDMPIAIKEIATPAIETKSSFRRPTLSTKYIGMNVEKKLTAIMII